jgi:hypothetical protein
VNRIFHFAYFDPDRPTSWLTVTLLARGYCISLLCTRTYSKNNTFLATPPATASGRFVVLHTLCAVCYLTLRGPRFIHWENSYKQTYLQRTVETSNPIAVYERHVEWVNPENPEAHLNHIWKSGSSSQKTHCLSFEILFSLALQPQFGPWPTSMKLSVSLRFSRS